MSQPSLIDLVTPFDPTGYTTVTGAQLEQLVSGTSVYSDKGFIVVTTDVAGNPNVPDAATTTKWQRYLWLRIQASQTTPYVWNPAAASDVTLLQWQTVAQSSIGVGTIVNSMIADNTIQDVKIANLSYSKLTGAPTGLPPSGAAGGDLTGTYPNPSVANAAITTSKVANNAITHALLGAQAVQPVTDIQPNGSYKDMLRTNNGATAMEFFTPPVIFTSGVVVPTANALKIPQVNTGATDFQMVASTTLGRILQRVTIVSAAKSVTNYTTAPSAYPTYAAALTTTNLALAFSAPAFTPLSAASTIVVKVVLNLAQVSTAIKLIAALLDTKVSATAMQAAAIVIPSASAFPVPVEFIYSIASWGTGSSSVYSAYYGNISPGNSALNSADGSTSAFGGSPALTSYIEITEYI